MLLTYVSFPQKISFKYISDLISKVDLLLPEVANMFYNNYCSVQYKYDEKNFDLSNIDEKEVYILNKVEKIFAFRHVKNIIMEAINLYLFSIHLLEEDAHLGDDIFCIRTSHETILGCPANSRYSNSKVYNKVHVRILALKMLMDLKD